MEGNVDQISPLEQERLNFRPLLPKVLQNLRSVVCSEGDIPEKNEMANRFPHTSGKPFLKFTTGEGKKKGPLKVGCVLSGGQAAGGHNVICALFDALKELDSGSELLGFEGGPGGILEGKSKALTQEFLASYRNTGGFDMIGSGRTKIEKPEQFEKAFEICSQHALDGLVIIGGDDSNTNAAHLAEFFAAKKCKTAVVGVPKTIDGDLKGEEIEISFGFDTACKIYSELIGNIARDALSAKKYYHFIKLMGRSASHVTLECALQTHPNLTLIGEEIFERKKTFSEITNEIVDLIVARSKKGKNYGVILIPEGIIEFIPEIKSLIKEINAILAKSTHVDVVKELSAESRATFSLFPEKLQHQLLLERDPHGNVQVSHIATEELLIHAVQKELKSQASYTGKFSPLNHFFGYEGRSAFPSNFDATYCTTLGMTAALLIHGGYSGYMATAHDLASPTLEWKVGGVPIVSMMGLEERKGKEMAVIAKALVDLKGAPFKKFEQLRQSWRVEDHYRFPGAVQYEGKSADLKTFTLLLEQSEKVRA